MTLKTIQLGELMLRRGGSVDPSKHKNEEFDLYSIPAFDKGASELVMGCDIGSSKQNLEQNDVLLSKIVPHIRRAWVVGELRGKRQIGSGEWIVFRSKAINPKYLSHVLVGDPFHAAFMQTVSGVGGSLLRARPAQVAEISIPLPPLAEQKRIARILDAADALRAKRREALAQLDALLQSTFLTLFGDPVTNPMGWPELEFDQIVTSTKLGLVRGSTEFGWEMPVPYIRMDAITNDGHFLPEKVQKTYASKAEIEAYGLRTGDFLLNTRNSKELVGKITIFRGPLGWTFNNNIIRIRFRKDIEPDVISTQFRFSRVKQALEQRKAGTTSVFAIYWKELKTLPVLVPPLPLQQKFAAIVESIERQKSAQRAHLADLDALFAALQHRAFRGEL